MGSITPSTPSSDHQARMLFAFGDEIQGVFEDLTTMQQAVVIDVWLGDQTIREFARKRGLTVQRIYQAQEEAKRKFLAALKIR